MSCIASCEKRASRERVGKPGNPYIYHESGGRLHGHFDSPHLFARPIVALELFSEKTFNFGAKNTGMQPQEQHFTVRMPHGSVTIMEGYAANKINHGVRPVKRKATSLLLRRVHPSLLVRESLGNKTPFAWMCARLQRSQPHRRSRAPNGAAQKPTPLSQAVPAAGDRIQTLQAPRPRPWRRRMHRRRTRRGHEQRRPATTFPTLSRRFGASSKYPCPTGLRHKARFPRRRATFTRRSDPPPRLGKCTASGVAPCRPRVESRGRVSAPLARCPFRVRRRDVVFVLCLSITFKRAPEAMRLAVCGCALSCACPAQGGGKCANAGAANVKRTQGFHETLRAFSYMRCASAGPTRRLGRVRGK